MNNELINYLKENGYYKDALDVIKNRCEYLEHKKKWFFMRSDPSGRDFFEDIPLEYITDGERNSLIENIQDDLYPDDYSWENGYSIDDIDYEDLLYLIIDDLNKES